ncbi:hypothetical protein ASE00_16255 [Sphingomonas sp. Root710]|uniref:tyrosine-type recombinase/integrase n=1 Tax=Sphingomonas sp. Root710 TaxID=1736594 RepID=UPI0006F1EF01|nr:site-specific integrase [Sphingomonas sp. Root710]KRB80599.1 hypothetical protein ASE00_16255 [Sphingomonas sp. Root710]
MPARNKMNVKLIAKLKTPGVYSDGGGLYLRIRPSLAKKKPDADVDPDPAVAKSWLFIYGGRGKRIELGLGSYSDISLAKAREKAAAMRELVLEGQDPRGARPRPAQAAEPPVTFGKFAMEWLDDIEDGYSNRKHRLQWRSTIKTYAKALMEKPIADIRPEDVVEVLQPIWLTKTETAGRVRGRIERIIDAAKAKGVYQGENPARMRGNLDHLLPKRTKVEVKHHAALPYKAVPAFMKALADRQGIAAKALAFTVLTAARSGETRGLTWGEIDLEAKLWTVPAERMKARAMHQVPLTAPALAILEIIRPEKADPGQLVFPAPRGGMLSDMTMTAVLKRMKVPVTTHGFRSSFRDWAGDETQHDRESIELSLAHMPPSATERAYRRSQALAKRRELMNDWAAYCLGSS